ncbi:MAG: four helix bundle protein [Dehalococcoidia bacterium]|nr:four helix bundle protein [Dehalococcoidia bacterium]
MIEKRVYSFALDIITFVDQLPKGQVSNVIGEQLLRSATSIGANVVEAQGAVSRKDYANFFSYALKSANETKFWLSLLQDSGKADKSSADRLLKETI